MIFKRYDTLSWKMIAFSLAAMVCTTIIIMSAYYGATFLLWLHPPQSSPPFYVSMIRWSVNTIGFAPVMVIAFVPLFILFFHLFSRQTMQRVQSLSSGMAKIAEGELNYRLPVSSKDELGSLSLHVNQMMDRLNHAMDEERTALQSQNHLITGVSHDLRTPLTSIIGFLGYIESDRYRDEIELRHYVHIAYEKSLTLQKLIDDLLDYTRVTYNQIAPQHHSIDLHQLLEQLAEECVPLFEQAHMDYQITVQGESPIIQGNGEELVRLFENLFANAIRYGYTGKRLDIQIIQHQQQVQVSCINYGSVIPSTDIPHIFERFYRGDSSRSNYAQGSGLGLAIAKSIVDRHHGEISVRSDYQSTVFDTIFPIIPNKKLAHDIT